MDQILLVEDDENLGVSLKRHLEDEGFKVTLTPKLNKARTEDLNQFKVVILDWMLPDGQGIDYVKEIRQKKFSTPVIMLTARTELIDKVLGLEAGSNDYLTKPFEPRELVARIRVQLRQSVPAPKTQVESKVIAGDLVIDLVKREVSYKENVLEMTKMEYELLKLLSEAPGRVFSREEILNKVWGFENYPSTRTVDTHVLQLRQKLDDDLIETVRGIGYRFKQILQ